MIGMNAKANVPERAILNRSPVSPPSDGVTDRVSVLPGKRPIRRAHINAPARHANVYNMDAWSHTAGEWGMFTCLLSLVQTVNFWSDDK